MSNSEMLAPQRPNWGEESDPLIKTLRTILADTPLANVATPSSLPTRYSPTSALGYANLSATGFAPSAHILTSTTSVGFPTRPARPPATPAQATVHAVERVFWPVCWRAFSETRV